jgi:histidine triad (HIT) family protein
MATLFEKIVAREIPATIVHQDDRVTAFRDINPQAPVHVLVIPKAHHATLADLAHAAPDSLVDLGLTIRAVAEQEGLAAGYRTVFNTGEAALQTVHHVHGHVVGGRTLTWPPG